MRSRYPRIDPGDAVVLITGDTVRLVDRDHPVVTQSAADLGVHGFDADVTSRSSLGACVASKRTGSGAPVGVYPR